MMKIVLLLLMLVQMGMVLLVAAVIHLVVHPLFTALALDESGRGENRS